MKIYMIVAIVLIVIGILGLVYGKFSYTKDSDTANLGPIEVTFNERETVNIPVWAGAGSIIAGIGLLAFVLIRQ